MNRIFDGLSSSRAWIDYRASYRETVTVSTVPRNDAVACASVAKPCQIPLRTSMSLMVVALCAACGAGTPDSDISQGSGRAEVAVLVEAASAPERRPGSLSGDDYNTVFGLQDAIQAAEPGESQDPPVAVVDPLTEPGLGGADGDAPAPVIIPAPVENVDTDTPVEVPVVMVPTPVVAVPEPVIEVPVVAVPEPVIEVPVVAVPEPVIEVPVVAVPEPVIDMPVVAVPEPVIEVPVAVVPEPVIDVPVVAVPEPVIEVPVAVVPEPVVEVPLVAVPEPVIEVPVVIETPTEVETPVVTEAPDVTETVAPIPVVAEPETEIEADTDIEVVVVTDTPEIDESDKPVELAVEDTDPAPVVEIVTPGSDEDRTAEPAVEGEVDTDEIVAEEPVIEVPVAEVPVAEVPVSEVPVSEVPVAEVPVAETPVTVTPVAEAPVVVPVDSDGDGVTDSDTDTVVTVEPEPAEEEVVAVVVESTPETGSGTTIEDLLDAMNTEENVSSTFAEIQDSGLDNACYMDSDHYVAEFLYQNPEVCFWEVDEAAQVVRAVPTPVVPDNAIPLPVPSGGDDTSALESIINANAGKTVVGRGVYKVNELDINVKIDIFDMPMEPTSRAQEMVHINASDVRIFNSPMDGKGSNRTNIGIHVQDGSHRFVLVNSGFSNIYHKEKRSAAGVFIRGADDFHIACNRFVNIINDNPARTTTARANAIWMNGSNRKTTAGGVVVNNYGEEFQSNGKLKDAEFFTEQNYASTSESRPTLVMGNRGFNAGKRMTKHQSDNAKVLSNFYEWKDKQGPLGTRLLLSHVEVQFSSNIIARNNRMKIDAEGRYDYIFFADSKLNRGVQDNLHYDCNDVEFKQKHNKDGGSRPQIITIRSSDKPKNGTGMAPTNSSANYNRFHGTGSVRWYYWFGEGVEDRGGIFEYVGNNFEIPYEVSKYKDP